MYKKATSAAQIAIERIRPVKGEKYAIEIVRNIMIRKVKLETILFL